MIRSNHIVALTDGCIVCRKTSRNTKTTQRGGKAYLPRKELNMKLNQTEHDYYENTLKRKVSNAPTGISFTPAMLFDKDPVSPRMCRKFFEEVSAGLIPNIRRIGSRSQDGYTVI